MQHQRDWRREEGCSSLDFDSSFDRAPSFSSVTTWFWHGAGWGWKALLWPCSCSRRISFLPMPAFVQLIFPPPLAWIPALSVLQGNPAGLCQCKEGQEHAAKCEKSPELQVQVTVESCPRADLGSWGAGQVLRSVYTEDINVSFMHLCHRDPNFIAPGHNCEIWWQSWLSQVINCVYKLHLQQTHLWRKKKPKQHALKTLTCRLFHSLPCCKCKVSVRWG